MPETNPPTRIYIANDDHTDYFWTADAETYARVFVELIDFHLALADETQHNPPAFRNRFNLDGTLWVWEYARQKSPEEFARLIERVRDGTISVPLNTLVSCYGAQPAEAVLRGMAYAGQLERRHNLRLTQAVAMENQTLPLGLSSLWAGAGARYTWRGICGCASRMDRSRWGARDHEIYWYAGHDGQRVLMKWHSLAPGGNQNSGGYAEAFDPVAAIRFLDSDPEFLKRYRAPGAGEPYSARAAFGFGWDALARTTGETAREVSAAYPRVDHFHTIAEAQTTPARRVIVSNQEDFFRDFEATHGAELPTKRVTHGNEWDLYSASMVETSAKVKRAVEKLRAAEAMASLVAAVDPSFLDGRAEKRDEAFRNLGLYWEHDWTADGPVPRHIRAAWQQSLADQIEAFVNTLHDDARRALGKKIANDSPHPSFFVFNPLGHARDSWADWGFKTDDVSGDFHVVDRASGETVPSHFSKRDLGQSFRVYVRNVPPIGYRVLEIRPGKGEIEFGPAARVEAIPDSGGAVLLENERVRVVVKPNGTIESLIDLADPTARNLLVRLNEFEAKNGGIPRPIKLLHSDPIYVRLLCLTDPSPDVGSVAPMTVLTLYRDSNRVEIGNAIIGNFSETKHWTFRFDLDDPVVRTEEVGAILTVRRESDGGDYADTNARYDYATLNHFVDIGSGEDGVGATISSPDLSFVRLGDSTPSHLDTKTPALHVLAGGQVDGPNLGIQNQNGQTLFHQRFAIRPRATFDAADVMRFALENQNPLVAGEVVGSDPRYPGATFSFLTVSEPDTILWALKPHNDGIEHGLVARLWNLAETPRTVTILLAQPIASARRLTHIETEIESIATPDGVLTVTIDARRMETFGLSV